MKKIIGLLVAAVICVGGAFALNPSSGEPEDRDIAKQENSTNIKNEGDKSGEEEGKKDTISLEEGSKENPQGDGGENQSQGSKDNSSNKDTVVNTGTTNTGSNSGAANNNNENPGKPNEENGSSNNEEPEKVETVTITINAQKAIDYGILSEDGFGHLPSNGVILGTTTVEIKEGDNVYDVLAKVVRDNKIHMEYTGTGSAIYIQGIDNLYEFDCGKYSGWMYEVNGTYPNYGVGAYKLKAGDKITFNYTCDLGKDLGAPVN